MILLLAVGVLGFFEDPNEFEELPEQKFPPHEEREEQNPEVVREQMEDDLEWLDELVKKERNSPELLEVETVPTDKVEHQNYEESKEYDVMLKLSEKDLEVIKDKVLKEIMKNLAENEIEVKEIDHSLTELQTVEQTLENTELQGTQTHNTFQDLTQEIYTDQTLQSSSEDLLTENLTPELNQSLEATTDESPQPTQNPAISSLPKDVNEITVEETYPKSPYSSEDQDEQIKTEAGRVETQIESNPFYGRGSETEDTLEDQELKALTYVQSDSDSYDGLQGPSEEELDTEITQTVSQGSSDFSAKVTSQSPFLPSSGKQTLNEMRLEQANSEDMSLPGSAMISAPEALTTNWGSIFIISVIFMAFLGMFTMYSLFIQRKKKVSKHSSEMRTFNPYTGQSEKYKLLKP